MGADICAYGFFHQSQLNVGKYTKQSHGSYVILMIWVILVVSPYIVLHVLIELGIPYVHCVITILGNFYNIRSVVFWSISCTSLRSTTKTTGIFHQCSQLRGVGICLACQHHSNIHREEWFLADRNKILGTFQTFDPFFFLFGELDDWWLMPWFLGWC